jgi:hypothetical protein
VSARVCVGGGPYLSSSRVCPNYHSHRVCLFIPAVVVLLFRHVVLILHLGRVAAAARHLEASPALGPAQALALSHGRLALAARLVGVDVHRAAHVDVDANHALGLLRCRVVLAKRVAARGRLGDCKDAARGKGAVDLGVAAEIANVRVLARDDEGEGRCGEEGEHEGGGRGKEVHFGGCGCGGCYCICVGGGWKWG